jgi:hypothetical protein
VNKLAFRLVSAWFRGTCVEQTRKTLRGKSRVCWLFRLHPPFGTSGPEVMSFIQSGNPCGFEAP